MNEAVFIPKPCTLPYSLSSRVPKWAETLRMSSVLHVFLQSSALRSLTGCVFCFYSACRNFTPGILCFLSTCVVLPFRQHEVFTISAFWTQFRLRGNAFALKKKKISNQKQRTFCYRPTFLLLRLEQYRPVDVSVIMRLQ